MRKVKGWRPPQRGWGTGKGWLKPALSALQQLLRYTSAMWLPSKATGISEGINSPFTNPLIDLKGVVGKNLFDGFLESGGLNSSTGAVVADPTRIRSVFFIPVLPNTTYTVNAVSVGSLEIQPFYYDFNQAFISRNANVSVNPLTFTTPSNCAFIKLRLLLTNTNQQIQLELGSVATAYEPYGKANLLLQGFAGTPASGYTLEPVIRDNGEPVLFDNLLGADGNMIDSNADNRADGWTYFDSTPISCLGNEVVFYPTAQYRSLFKTTEVRSQSVGDVLYYCASIKCASSGAQLKIALGSGVNALKNHTGGGQYEFLSASGALVDKTASGVYLEFSLSSGFSNISVKQAHLFNLTTMFPNPSTRPTKTQMDFLVQWAISKYGYINEQIIKIAWVVMLKFDGTNDYGIANHPSLDIVGLSDFSIECVFKTDATLTTGYVAFKGLESVATIQYALSLGSEGAIRLYLNGIEYFVAPISPLQINTLYTLLVYRVNGRLKTRFTKVETYNQLNAINISTRPHFRVGARSASSDGLTHTNFSNAFLGHLSITNGALQPFTEAELVSKFDKFTMQTFGI